MIDNSQPGQVHAHVEPWMLELADKLMRDDFNGTRDEVAAAIAAASPRFTVTSWDKETGRGQMPCPNCCATVTMRIAQAIPFNSGTVSLLAVVHKPAHCNNCGRDFVPFITGGAVQCGVAEVAPESSIILPQGVAPA